MLQWGYDFLEGKVANYAREENCEHEECVMPIFWHIRLIVQADNRLRALSYDHDCGCDVDDPCKDHSPTCSSS